MGHALLLTGEIAAAQAHYSQGLPLYDPAEHRPFATRFGQDISVTILGFRSLALWLLGYPEKALADASRALKDAQEIGQAATLMFALNYTAKTQTHCGNYAAANSLLEQLIALADQKGAPYWKAFGMSVQGCVLVANGDTSGAVQLLTLGMTALRSTGATLYVPWLLSNLARAYVDLGGLDDAWRCIDEAMTAMQTSEERWCEAEVNRIAGEIALKSSKPDTAKAEAHFERALAVADWPRPGWASSGKREARHDRVAIPRHYLAFA
jgi:predicted ATPase